MKILIAAIGKAKPSPEQELMRSYLKRLPWKVECKEFDSRGDDGAKRKAKENAQLLDACKGSEKIIALDESGKALGSREFAEMLGKWQQQGCSSVAFIIGGADGLEAETLQKSNLVWSLGRVTWPHMLMRALLAEQLYRAYSVLTNHPYHRD